jgi:hypothetical protein
MMIYLGRVEIWSENDSGLEKDMKTAVRRVDWPQDFSEGGSVGRVVGMGVLGTAAADEQVRHSLAIAVVAVAVAELE